MPVNPTPAQSQSSRENGRLSGGRPPERDAIAMTSFSFRLTVEELSYLRADAAQSSADSASDFVRRKITGKPIHSQQDLAIYKELINLREEIKRQGGLLKHAVNEGVIDAKFAIQILNKQAAQVERVDAFVDALSLSYARRGAAA